MKNQVLESKFLSRDLFYKEKNIWWRICKFQNLQTIIKCFSVDKRFFCYVKMEKNYIISQIIYYTIYDIDPGGITLWKVEAYFEISTLYKTNPVGTYMFKVNNRNTRTRCKICLSSVIGILHISLIFRENDLKSVILSWNDSENPAVKIRFPHLIVWIQQKKFLSEYITFLHGIKYFDSWVALTQVRHKIQNAYIVV